MNPFEGGTDPERAKAIAKETAKTSLEALVPDPQKQQEAIQAANNIIDYIFSSPTATKEDLKQKIDVLSNELRNPVTKALQEAGLLAEEPARRGSGQQRRRKGGRARDGEAPEIPTYKDFIILLPGDPRRIQKEFKDQLQRFGPDEVVIASRKEGQDDFQYYASPVPVPTRIKSMGPAYPWRAKFIDGLKPALQAIHDATQYEFDYSAASKAPPAATVRCLNRLQGPNELTVKLTAPVPDELLGYLKKDFGELRDIEETAKGDDDATKQQRRLAGEALAIRNTLRKRAQAMLASQAVRNAGYDDIPRFKPDPVRVIITTGARPPAPEKAPAPAKKEEGGQEGERALQYPEWLKKLVDDKTEVKLTEYGKTKTVIFGDRVQEIIGQQLSACAQFIKDRFLLAAAKIGDDTFLAESKTAPLKGLTIKLAQISEVVGPERHKALMTGKEEDVADVVEIVMELLWAQAEKVIAKHDIAGAPDVAERAKRCEDLWQDLEQITFSIKNYFKNAKLSEELDKLKSATTPPGKPPGKKESATAKTSEGKPEAGETKEEPPPDLKYLSEGEELTIAAGEGAARKIERWTFKKLIDGGRKVLVERLDELGHPIQNEVSALEVHLMNRDFKEHDTIVWLNDAGQFETNWEIFALHKDAAPKTADIQPKGDPTKIRAGVPLAQLRELFPSFDTRAGNANPETVRFPTKTGWEEGWSVMPRKEGEDEQIIYISKAGLPGRRYFPAALLRAWNPPAYVKERTAEALTEFEKALTTDEKKRLDALKAKFEAQFGSVTDDRRDWFNLRQKFRQKILKERAQSRPR